MLAHTTADLEARLRPLLLLTPRACADDALRERLQTSAGDRANVVCCEDHDTLRTCLRHHIDPGREAPVLLCGGDGSLHHALQTLASATTPPPVGLVPAGTANDAVRGLGLPGDPVEALELYLSGQAVPTPTDLVCANEHWLLNVLTAGSPAEATRTTPDELKQALGGLAYVAHGLPKLVAPPAFGVSVEVDDQRWEGRAFAVFLGNLPFAGNGFPVCPGADPHDGQLDVTVLFEQALPLLWSVAGDAMLGGDAPDYGERVERFRGRRARIVLQDAAPVSFDGEARDTRIVEAEARPGAIRLLLPPRAVHP